MKLRYWPDAALKAVATPVEDMGDLDDWIQLRLDATSLMHEKGGIGLAANQVGDPRAWFIYSAVAGGGATLVVNPKAVETGENRKVITASEGCLSFPGRRVQKPRRNYVEVEGYYMDPHTQSFVFEVRQFPGQLARVAQHELDHLRGRNCVTHR
jgi:peptide deformylase